jgi:hypothetical protein
MFEIIDLTGNPIATSADGGTLFARLADLNGPRGDAGYTLRRVPAAPPVETTPAAPAPVEVDRVVIPGKTIDEAGAARIAATRAILTASGIAVPEAWFSAGTDMLPAGEAVFHSIARDFDSQIPFRDAAELAINGIRGQNRRDVIVDPGDVSRIRLEDGWLRINGRRARIGMSALRDLMGKYSEVFPAAGRWASVMGRAALEASIADGFDRWGHRDAADRPVQLRIRDHGVTGEPVVWAVVGAQYPGRPTDADAVLRAMLAQVGNDRTVKGEVTLNPNTGELTARAVWMDRTIKNPKVGDIFQATLIARTRDDAKGAFSGNGGITAIRCINCSLAQSTFGEGRGIHRSQASIDKAVRSAFNGFRKQADDLLSHWGYLTAAELEVEDDDGTPIAAPEEALVKLGETDSDVVAALSGVGVDAPIMGEMLRAAYVGERDAGRMDGSLADVVRAIAKMGQDRRLDNQQRIEAEIASGRLIPILARRAQAATA